MKQPEDLVLYVHGKGGSAHEAGHYKMLFPNHEVIGFDYRSQTPWEAREEFPAFLPSRESGAGVSPWSRAVSAPIFRCPRWMRRWWTGPISFPRWWIWKL